MLNEDPSVVKKVLDKSKSIYDQSRDTVGKIYRDTKINAPAELVTVGDMSNSLVPDLIDDINAQIKVLDPHYLKYGIPYFLIMVEKRDLQMPDRMDRLFSHKYYRPWPEANTTVFYKNPKTQDLRFCWSLPHRAEMIGILKNPEGWDDREVALYRAWEKLDLTPFGFMHSAKMVFDKNIKKNRQQGWIPNPKWEDQKIKCS